MAQKQTQAHPEKKVAPKKGTVAYHPKFTQALEDELRGDILEACRRFESEIEHGHKDYLRRLHLEAKQHNSVVSPQVVRALFTKYQHLFKSGAEIDPTKIKPVLHLVCDTRSNEIFKVVRSLWSLPFNKGYGRRLRFIVYDEFHDGIIGILGLQSPPADLQSRDTLFAYPEDKKLELVNSTMDAYTVGAIPPYSYLLGGKLCAGLLSTDTIRQAYWSAYAGKKTLMQKTNVKQPLAAITTTSAFGRSSMYNRIKYKDRLLAEPIGYTLGYGTLHLEHLYEKICDYLRTKDKLHEGGFGKGPKARWQNITNALVGLGLPSGLLRHGVKREVFLFRLVENLKAGMSGGNFGNPLLLEESTFSEYWKERWAIPRADRYPTWNSEDSKLLLQARLKEFEGL